jgi:hypothetical protein
MAIKKAMNRFSVIHGGKGPASRAEEKLVNRHCSAIPNKLRKATSLALGIKDVKAVLKSALDRNEL